MPSAVLVQCLAVIRMESIKTAIALNPRTPTSLESRLKVWIAVLSAMFLTSVAQSASVVLAWDASRDAIVVGYTVRYGTSSETYSDFLVVGPDTSATVSGLTEGATYFFAVSAYTLTGLESDPSAEVEYTVPYGGPSGDQPTLDAISNLTLNEDAGQQTINLTGISAGLGGILQLLGLGVTATSSNPSLIPHPTVTYTSPGTTGGLRFTPASGAAGTATITVTVNNFKLLNNLFSRSFVVTVNSVNDAPTLNPLNNLVLGLNAAPLGVALSGIGSGAANEVQPLTVTATSSNPSLIPDPTISYAAGASSGSLVIEPRTGVSGSAIITVRVNDGQGANNVVQRSFSVAVGTPANAGVYVEAETGSMTLPMEARSDTGAANGRYVTTLSANQGALTLPVIVPTAGTYYVWCRIKSVNDNSDSFFVSLNGAGEQVFGTASNRWSANWQWTRVNGDNGGSGNPRTFNLSQGSHTFVFRGREASTMIDAIYVTTDSTFVPAQAPRLAIVPVSQPTAGMRVGFETTIGSSFDLQASENLTSWTTIGSSAVATGIEFLSFVDNTPTATGKRFYRLRSR